MILHPPKQRLLLFRRQAGDVDEKRSNNDQGRQKPDQGTIQPEPKQLFHAAAFCQQAGKRIWRDIGPIFPASLTGNNLDDARNALLRQVGRIQ